MTKRMRCLLALSIALLMAVAPVALADSVITNSTADCFDFYPAVMTFEDNAIVIEGYFFNFNLNRTISDISELEISVYDSSNKLVCEGTFTELSSSLQNMRLIPGVSSLQKFTFADTARNPDNFDFSYGFYVSISCRFTSADY